MSGDTLFRNAAIGGFNKEDVMKYIEVMKSNAVENEVNLDRAVKQLSKEQRRAADAEAEAEKLKQRVQQLQKENEKLEKRAETAEAEKAALLKRLSSFENSKSKLAAIEVQLGALMVDAHMYADKIVETAKMEAKRISEETKQIVAQAKVEIADISDDFLLTSDEYSRLLTIINTKISDLPVQFDAISDSVKNDYESMDFAVDTLEDIPMPEFEAVDLEDFHIDEAFIDETIGLSESLEENGGDAEAKEDSIDEEVNSKLDELMAELEADIADEESVFPAVEKAEEEPFSMKVFFEGLDNAETQEEVPAAEDNTSEAQDNSEDTVDFSKFFDILGDSAE